jgi:hypothetical protein
MRTAYEIPVYNAEVRKAIENRETHTELEAKWADTHLIMIRAHTPDEAMTICRRKHPEKMGFILGDVMEA